MFFVALILLNGENLRWNIGWVLRTEVKNIVVQTTSSLGRQGKAREDSM